VTWIGQECPNVENFTDEWWQINLTTGPAGNCYLFSSDGYVVESDGDENWPTGKWSETPGECESTIVTDEDEFELIGYAESCWEIEYNDDRYTACECSL